MFLLRCPTPILELLEHNDEAASFSPQWYWQRHFIHWVPLVIFAIAGTTICTILGGDGEHPRPGLMLFKPGLPWLLRGKSEFGLIFFIVPILT